MTNAEIITELATIRDRFTNCETYAECIALQNRVVELRLLVDPNRNTLDLVFAFRDADVARDQAVIRTYRPIVDERRAAMLEEEARALEPVRWCPISQRDEECGDCDHWERSILGESTELEQCILDEAGDDEIAILRERYDAEQEALAAQGRRFEEARKRALHRAGGDHAKAFDLILEEFLALDSEHIDQR